MHRYYCALLLALALLLAACGATSQATPAPPTPIPAQLPGDTPTPIPAPPPGDIPAPTPTPPSGAPTLGVPLQLRVGASAIVDQLTLTLAAVQNDSRCPALVSCFWAGEAEVVLQVQIAGRDEGSRTLTLAGQNRADERSSTTVGNYAITFLSLEPYPQQPEPIATGAYVATLIVSDAAQAAYAPVEGDGYTGVIVPAAAARAFASQVDGYWTPNAQDVQHFEADLVAFLKQAAPAQSSDLWQKQAGYVRQYVGLIDEGHRFLYGSFMCRPLDDTWRSQVVVVADGGDCYFQLSYDIERKAYFNLMINGDA